MPRRRIRIRRWRRGRVGLTAEHEERTATVAKQYFGMEDAPPH